MGWSVHRRAVRWENMATFIQPRAIDVRAGPGLLGLVRSLSSASGRAPLSHTVVAAVARAKRQRSSKGPPGSSSA